MANYKNGKIYKIYSNKNKKLIYIGSTTKKLNERFSGHKACYNDWKDEKINKNGRKVSHFTSYDIFEKYNVNSCKIELIENYNCSTKDELIKREAYHIKKNKNICVNRCIPKRTQKDYYLDNREEKLLKSKKRYQEKKDDIKKYKKIYIQKNKEKISDYHKEYRKLTYDCECGSHIKFENKAKHIKSEKHQSYINHPTYKLRQTIRRFKEVSEMYKIINGL